MLLVGFLFYPSEGYACVSKTASVEKTCCSKMKKSDSHQTNCSDKDSNPSCDGSCNSTNCHFTPVFSGLTVAFSFIIPQKMELICSKETNFFYLEKQTSLNYFAIWSPPKIG